MRMEFVTICKVSHKRCMEVWVDICSTLLFLLLNSNYVSLSKSSKHHQNADQKNDKSAYHHLPLGSTFAWIDEQSP